MEKSKFKKYLKPVIQLAVTALAIYLVIRQIDMEAYKKQLLCVKPGWLLLAALAFNGSKMLSAFRLNHFFRALDLRLNEVYNLKLYYLGMLYNQVFPGGIGGDGYKVYLLNKRYKTPVKSLVTATLIDRVSGVVALVFFALVTALIGHTGSLMQGFDFLLFGGVILIYPAYYLLVHLVFPTYKKVNHITNVQALGVQGMQVLCAWFLLQSLGVEIWAFDYFTLFLVSSVAAALPVSAPGGIGVREWVMLTGAGLLELNENAAVALASLFFVITLFSALLGVRFIKF